MKNFVLKMIEKITLLVVVMGIFILPHFVGAINFCDTSEDNKYGCPVYDEDTSSTSYADKNLRITDGQITLNGDEALFKIEVNYKKNTNKRQPIINKGTKLNMTCTVYSNLVGNIDFAIKAKVKRDIYKGNDGYVTATLSYPHFTSLLEKKLADYEDSTTIKCRIGNGKKANVDVSY